MRRRNPATKTIEKTSVAGNACVSEPYILIGMYFSMRSRNIEVKRSASVLETSDRAVAPRVTTTSGGEDNKKKLEAACFPASCGRAFITYIPHVSGRIEVVTTSRGDRLKETNERLFVKFCTRRLGSHSLQCSLNGLMNIFPNSMSDLCWKQVQTDDVQRQSLRLTEGSKQNYIKI